MLKILNDGIYCGCGGELFTELNGADVVSIKCKLCNEEYTESEVNEKIELNKIIDECLRCLNE